MRNDKEENKNNGPVIPLYKKCPKCGTEYWITEEKCSKCGTELGDNDDASSAYKGETLEEEFAKAAKDGTLHEKYSEYLKRSEERLKDPYLANLKDSIKEDIRQLKEAYYKAAGLSKKICPKCGEEYGEDYKYAFCRKDGGKLLVIWKCQHCGEDLTNAQGYSAINVCPNCGKGLDEKQKKVVNSSKRGEANNLKRICINPECREIFDDEFEYCGKCGSQTIPMQCSCGEIFRQREDGSFDKYCPKCGKHDPIVEQEKHIEWIDNLKVGDIIEFGSYPYEADGTEKPIEWIILEKYSDGTALVISKYGLDAVRFDKKSGNWEKSEIRQWLNNEFYNKAFKNADKSLIMETRLEQTSDKMFLLSIEEAKTYFSSDRDRICLPTPYAKTNKTKTGRPVYTNAESGGSCWWWLRSPGYNRNDAAYVSIYGIVNSLGNFVYIDDRAVRVAFKINLKNL